MSKFSHLTNNCIAQKFSDSPANKKKREKSLDANDVASDEEEEMDNIWSLDDFKQHLQSEFGEKYKDQHEDIFQEIIYPQIKHQVKASCLSVQDMVNNRKNSFEFIGYDFMVDENLRVWLIEVNSSPSMDSHN